MTSSAKRSGFGVFTGSGRFAVKQLQHWPSIADLVINGGGDDDLISSGAGADLFIFTQLNDGETDIIADCTNGEDIFCISASQIETVAGSGSQGILDALNNRQVDSDVQVTYEGHTIIV